MSKQKSSYIVRFEEKIDNPIEEGLMLASTFSFGPKKKKYLQQTVDSDLFFCTSLESVYILTKNQTLLLLSCNSTVQKIVFL